MAYGIGAGVTNTEPVPYGNTETVITKWSQTVNITSDATHILVDLLRENKIQLVFQYSPLQDVFFFAVIQELFGCLSLYQLRY